MTNQILQEFLRLRLLDLGAEDGRLVKLAGAAEDLSTSFAENPKDSLPILLAALDPNVGEDKALLSLASAVEAHWPTYRSAFQGEPVTLYRAVALEAFAAGSKLQPALATAVYLIARNLLPHLPIGNEQVVYTNLLKAVESQYQDMVQREWAPAAESYIANVTLPPLPPPKKANKDLVAARLEAAVGPSNRAGNTLENANQNWSNAAPAWSYDFSDRMTTLLIELHESAATTASTARGKADNAVASAVSEALNGMTGWVVSQTVRLTRMTDLMWWRHALHSESAASAYRSVPSELVPVYMALDVANMLPDVYPTSIESFLAEAVLALRSPDSMNEPITLDALYGTLTASQHVQLHEVLRAFGRSGHGRCLLAEAVKESGSEFTTSRLGLPQEFALPIEQWAVWMLREFKALQALKQVNPQAQAHEPG